METGRVSAAARIARPTKLVFLLALVQYARMADPEAQREGKDVIDHVSVATSP